MTLQSKNKNDTNSQNENHGIDHMNGGSIGDEAKVAGVLNEKIGRN